MYKIKWKFFESLEFLSDSATPRETLSTIDDDDQNQENIQLYAAPTVPSVPPVPPYRPPNKRGRKQHDTTSADNLIEEAHATLKSIAQGKRNTCKPAEVG